MNKPEELIRRTPREACANILFRFKETIDYLAKEGDLK